MKDEVLDRLETNYKRATESDLLFGFHVVTSDLIVLLPYQVIGLLEQGLKPFSEEALSSIKEKR